MHASGLRERACLVAVGIAVAAGTSMKRFAAVPALPPPPRANLLVALRTLRIMAIPGPAVWHLSLLRIEVYRANSRLYD